MLLLLELVLALQQRLSLRSDALQGTDVLCQRLAKRAQLVSKLSERRRLLASRLSESTSFKSSWRISSTVSKKVSTARLRSAVALRSSNQLRAAARQPPTSSQRGGRRQPQMLRAWPVSCPSLNFTDLADLVSKLLLVCKVLAISISSFFCASSGLVFFFQRVTQPCKACLAVKAIAPHVSL